MDREQPSILAHVYLQPFKVFFNLPGKQTDALRSELIGQLRMLSRCRVQITEKIVALCGQTVRSCQGRLFNSQKMLRRMVCA